MSTNQAQDNQRHPEQADDEVFVGNYTADVPDEELTYKTRRFGAQTFDANGNPFVDKGMCPLRPVFVKRKEIEAHPNARVIIPYLQGLGSW